MLVQATLQGWMYMSSSGLEMNRDADDCGQNRQYVGLRFQGINIDNGATIISATIEFTVDVADLGKPGTSDPLTVTISGQDHNDAPVFNGTNYNLSGRSYLGTTVIWSPDPWTATPEAYNSDDISSIIQGIVNKPGWASGNAMVFMLDGDGSSGIRMANSADSSGVAPKLKILYS